MEAIERFFIPPPGATGFTGGFLKWQTPGKLLCGASCSAGKQHRWAVTLALACRTDRDLLGAALCWFLQSEKLLQQIWLLRGVRDTDCAVGKCAESWVAVGSLSLPMSSCGLWAAFPLCQRALFSPWFCLGTRDVLVTGWGSFALKTLQSAHHNVHLLWQLVYPSPANMSVNYLPCARIPLALLTFHQRLGLPHKAEYSWKWEKQADSRGKAKKTWDQTVQHLSSRLVTLATIIKMDWD